MVIAIDEEAAIANAVTAQLKKHKVQTQSPIPISMSARHVHLTVNTIHVPFGDGYELTPEHPLSQPGQFTSEETVSLEDPRNLIGSVRKLGPARSKSYIGERGGPYIKTHTYKHQ